MKAGRDLDALIAEKIFELPKPLYHKVVYEFDKSSDDSSGRTCIECTSSESGAILSWPDNHARRLLKRVPLYSTKVCAAWPIVELLRKRGYLITIEGDNFDHNETWYVDFYLGDSNAPWKPGTKHAQYWASTVSEAICITALLLLESKESKE